MRSTTTHLLIAAAISAVTVATAIPAFAGSSDQYTERIKKRKPARPTAAPELGVNGAGAAFVLLGGGLLVANGRRCKKS